MGQVAFRIADIRAGAGAKQKHERIGLAGECRAVQRHPIQAIVDRRIHMGAVDEEQLEEWVDSEGREVALTRALMAIARDKLCAEGTKITMMQYLWYKQRSLESGMIKSAEFDEIERELLADAGSPDSHDFLCEVWSAAFVKRMRQQLLANGGTYH